MATVRGPNRSPPLPPPTRSSSDRALSHPHDTTGSVSVFKEIRSKVEEDFDEIVQCLKEKRAELLTQIEELELEHLTNQQRNEERKDKLKVLISHTEELADNSLGKLQQKMICDMQTETKKIESEESQNFDLAVRWEPALSFILTMIRRTTIIRIENYQQMDQENRTTVQRPKPVREFEHSADTLVTKFNKLFKNSRASSFT